ncbi:MAG: SDR family oxidoreductase [Actinomycetia bacterium]|nr:SDR family oxidoreductase [Actinomycetes bacterium]MCP4959520.1 SDR family oxidoreductase [Actinomycetes bacterium]
MSQVTTASAGAGRVALVTGVSRRIGIGHTVAQRLTADGFRVATAGWSEYDRRMTWGADDATPELAGPFYEIDFEDPTATESLVSTVCEDMGSIHVLVMCHCESIDSDIHTTTVDSFDRHMAVNARATWQLIKGFSEQPDGVGGSARIVSITSDATVGNLPYGASKGAMDRIVLAAAVELAGQGVTANVINPGATDTGWMSPEIEQQVLERNLQPRIGRPSDVANLVGFLCSPEGGWVNGQLLYSDGGLTP